MNHYIKNLKAFLSQQAPCFGYDDANSILDMLYYYYTTENPVDSGVIRCQFAEQEKILSKLSLEDNTALFFVTTDLCVAHARKGFLDGVQVGLRLFEELEELS